MQLYPVATQLISIFTIDMKNIIAIMLVVGSLFITLDAYAREGFWASNKLTIGYDQAYIATQVDVFQFEPVRTRVELGYIFEPYNNLDIVPRYILQLPRGENRFEHIFGLTLKLTFP